MSGINTRRKLSTASANTPLLVSGQTITSGVGGVSFGAYPESMLYVEATDAGTATLCATLILELAMRRGMGVRRC